MSLWREDLVIKNKYSRPAIPLVAVRGIVIHWTGNVGATDENHADFFDGADGGGSRYASAHIFIDRDSATLIIPLNEVAYHANESACRIAALKASTEQYKGGNANLTTLSIEMCVERDGTIHPDTIARTAQVTAELCKVHRLGTGNIYRHHDITGKNCPAPWVANPALFNQFKYTVAGLISQPTPVQQTPQPSGAIIVGSYVTVKKSATHYATEEAIASHVKGCRYQVLQVKAITKSFSKKMYLLAGIMSWVLEQDIEESGVSNSAPTPVSTPAPAIRKVVLPATDPTWTVYKLGHPCIKSNPANKAGTLKPSKFGGLTYNILKDNGDWVFEIQTANFGRVQIYAAPSTGAVIK